MAVVIEVDNLAKRYRLGVFGGRTLREDVQRWWAALRGRPDPLAMVGEGNHNNISDGYIWALREISFSVRQGEVLGVIGRNGAGKSTLLKILSRITAPSSGHARMKGRVSSMLEVGTGFHPELTGRENVFLNGAILGMTKNDVLERFDDIVDFSGVSAYIDTPVKRYSSGMKVRLAFAVAAHLEPEILLIDEVLAVGDAEFQKRCLNKVHNVAQAGRTVLFISHNMASVLRLCDRSLFLADGRLIDDGPSQRVVATYLQSGYGIQAARTWDDLDNAPGNENVRLRSVRIVDITHETVDTVDVRQSVGIEMSFDVMQECKSFVPWVALFNDKGEHVFSAFDTHDRWRRVPQPGHYSCTAWVPSNLLNEGSIIVHVSLNTFASGGRNIRQAHVDEAVTFHVADPGIGDTARGHYGASFPGPVRPLLDWTVDVKEREEQHV